MVTKRSGQAETALISRRSSTVERMRLFPKRIRAKTNQVRIGDLDGRTQIGKQSELNLRELARRASQASSWLPKRTDLPGSAGLIRDAREGSRHKGSRNQRRRRPRDSPRQRQSLFGPAPRRRNVMVAKAFHLPMAQRPDPGRRRRKRAQREPESATPRAARFAAQKAILIRPGAVPPYRHGGQSLPPADGSAPRSGTQAKEASTKGAGISDAAGRAIRRSESNPHLRLSERRTELMAHKTLIPHASLWFGCRPAKIQAKR